MGASQLLGFDLILSVLAAASWSAAACFVLDTARRVPAGQSGSSRLVLPVVGAAILLTAAKVAVVTLLATGSWLFASERVTIGLPLLVAPAVAGGVAGLRSVARRTSSNASAMEAAWQHIPPSVFVLWAAAGATGSLLVPFFLGYEPHPVALAAFLSLVAGAFLICWLQFGSRSDRRTTATTAVAALMLATVLGTAGLAWLGSRSAEGASIAAVGHHRGSSDGGAPEARSRPVTDLTGELPVDAPVRRFELTAQQERVTSDTGRTVDAWTFGSLPGPALEVNLGDVVEVLLANRNVAAGVTLHWHGYNVPNAMDGVAGATQNAVLPGQSMTYRFLARQTGTYWYHTHQLSSEGVRRGLYGTLVVRDPRIPQPAKDIIVAGHSLGSLTLLGSSDSVQCHSAVPGNEIRLRLVNTDSLPQRYQIIGAPYAVAAVDGAELERAVDVPAPGTILRIGAGGRMDATLAMPGNPVTLRMEGSASAAVVIIPADDDVDPDGDSATDCGLQEPAPADFRSNSELNLFAGQGRQVTEFAGAAYTRTAVMVLDRQLRFVNGLPRYAYTVNGAAYPHIPPLVVDSGDVVKLTVVNRTSEPHPMHPHGHHVQVLSRNGQVPQSNLRLDTFDVLPGDIWEVLLTADNPGIWMDHCHNLDHAVEGMMMHLQYRGYSSPFIHGGPSGNRAE